MKYVLGVMAIVLGLGGSWTAAEEIGPVSAPLEPMAKPERRVGDTWTRVNKKGEKSSTTVVAVDEATITFEDSDGCTYTKPLLHGFSSMSTKWSTCGGWVGGTQTVTLDKGDSWPLATGSKWRFKYSGKNEKGKRWKGKRSCRVKEEVRVSVPAGDFDTYHVVCNDGNRKREYYISPVLKSRVMYKFSHRYGKVSARTSKLISLGAADSE